MNTLATIFTSETFLARIPSVILLIIVCVILAKLLKVRISTDHIQIGGEKAEAYYERTIVRNQINAAHDYCMSLEGKILALSTDPEGKACYAKLALEVVFDKVVEWITFNHIESSEGYVKCKQREINSLVYMMNPSEPYRTKEFQERMDKWVAELIDQLVDIRKVYSKEKK